MLRSQFYSLFGQAILANLKERFLAWWSIRDASISQFYNNKTE